MERNMIEDVSDKNLEEVLPLIKQYQEFYKVSEINDKKNEEFFSQFNINNPFGCQFIYRNTKNDVIGFATVYFTFTSTIASKVAVLNDLYIVNSQRGQGVGKALIQHCKEFAKSKSAVRLQWVTAPDNETAQKLYDSLDTNKSTWYFYASNT